MLRVRTKVEKQKLLIISFGLSVLWVGLLCWADEQETLSNKKVDVPEALEGIWDSDRYISLEEIEPGMEACCLTEYGLAGIEEFGMEVVDVVRDVAPDRDLIFVKGTDERFIYTGPVAGCSGSPVYIDGRLAGALAYAATFSKDPLYGVTPIADMLKVGQGKKKPDKFGTANTGCVFDFSKPIDFAEIERQITTPRFSRNESLAGVSVLPCPLVTSGLPAKACEQLSAMLEPFGFMVVPGVGGRIKRAAQSQNEGAGNDDADQRLVPGACLAVPLVRGDITLSAYGTVTEVRGDKIYGLGHSFLGYGEVDLPIARGQVHTVISSVLRSAKLCSVVETVGALTTDESTAISGQIGAKARTIPLTIRIDRYNDIEPRVYNCEIVYNRLLTPRMLRLAVSGAASQLGGFPPDHMIEYSVAVGVEGFEPITFENVSTSRGLAEILEESTGSAELLMNNPFRKVDIKSIDFDIRIVPKNVTSHIWLVDVSDSKVRAGQEIKVEAVVESFLAEKKKYQFSLKVPNELAPGKYQLTVCGPYEYERFLRKAVPYRFIAQDMPSLIKALNNVLGIERDRLYCLLVLPPSGVTIEKAELADLPATKALVLQSGKRALRTLPYPHWLEKSLETGTVVIDKKVIPITVEE